MKLLKKMFCQSIQSLNLEALFFFFWVFKMDKTKCMFGFTFIELILVEITFIINDFS